jgi:predicted DNA-binding mobile mystery protein A
MAIQKTVQSQYQQIVDSAAEAARGISMPKEGWVRTARKALGMTGAQLARRMGISKAQVLQTEKGEAAGSATIKTMEKAAAALGCRFVYAIVPETATADIINKRAREKAKNIVEKTNEHMALESQTLSSEQLLFETDRLQDEFVRTMPGDLWNDE